MDIYQPVGDTMSHRPVIILGHGGSFVSGTRSDDSTIIWLCHNFAKRGYVTVSIDYRLGNPVSLVLDSSYAIDVVIKAISDGKAAQRFFVKDAATTNTYKIDTNNIFIGGNSAGAVLYMHAGYLTSIAEVPSYIATAMAANGGFDGNSGNAGYNVKSKAVIDLAGALNEVSFVNPGDKPSVNAQGDNDATVPYNCGYPLSGNVHVNLCGLGQLEAAYNANGIYHMSKIFPGDGHVPWASDAAKFFTVDSLVTEFLYNMVCTNVAGVTTVNAIAETSVFPNPASDEVNIKSSELLSDITIYDQTGRTVVSATGINKNNYELNTAHFYKGVYFVKIRYRNESIAQQVKSLVIE